MGVSYNKTELIIIDPRKVYKLILDLVIEPISNILAYESILIEVSQS